MATTTKKLGTTTKSKAFFEEFDKKGRTLVYQETTANGQKSNFNKLVSRDNVEDSEDDSEE